MAYIVVKHFTDLQDHGYKYAEGDIYPRKGYEPSAERIEMLSTAMNRQRTVLIEAVPEVIPETESAETVEESAVEETAEEKPKRKSRKKAE
jgi:hypothetical protein